MTDGLLLIDKAPGWTSHDVVAKCRGLLRERRVGHGGTLDPMATGLLVLFAGRATRAVPYLPGDKTYVARLRFGTETDTQDSTGRVLRVCGHIPSEPEVREILPKFTGPLTQIPPMVSAVQVNGQRLYKLARQGIEVERAPRPVTVYALEPLGFDGEEYSLSVTCSAGTYVRTLIHDIGHALGTCAVMTALRRVRSGPFSVGDACPVEVAAPERLLPVDTLFSTYPPLTLSPAYEKAARNGASFPAQGGGDIREGSFVRVYDENGEFLLLGRLEKEHIVTEKSFFP